MVILYKTEEDLDFLRKLGKQHSKILNSLGDFCSPGITTDDINRKAEERIKEAGLKASFLGYKPTGSERPFPASVCVSVNEEVVHGIPNEKPKLIKEGDLVSIDLGLSDGNVVTDSAITVCVGKCSKESRKINEATREALMKGIEAVRLGGNIGDIGWAIASYAKKTGYSVIKGLAGHGVGYSVHEDPYVPNTGRKKTGEIIKEGLVIAIEPMLTSGSGMIVLSDNDFTYITKEKAISAHWEHTVAVTKKGVEVITE